MEVVGATPFEDITDYRASDDGSHVLMKGWLGTREDHLAIKEQDALFVIRGLAYAIDLCELARGEEPKLSRLMPV